MRFLSWLLLKGEPGDQGGQGLNGEKGAEVSETCLRECEVYGWLRKVGTREIAVDYNSSSCPLS